MIGEPSRSQQASFFTSVPHKENRSLRLHWSCSKILRDLEHRYSSRSIVVGPIVDRIEMRGTNAMEAIDIDMNCRASRCALICWNPSIPHRIPRVVERDVERAQ